MPNVRKTRSHHPSSPNMKHALSLLLSAFSVLQVDGLTATREIRKMGCSVPIIACTASIDAADCAAAGCNDWLGKPFTRDGVNRILTKWLNAAASAALAGVPVESMLVA